MKIQNALWQNGVLTAQFGFSEELLSSGGCRVTAWCVSCRYKKVIAACALQSDLEQLPHGDRTEIGEKVRV